MPGANANDSRTAAMQRLRLRRFAIAVATSGVGILGTSLTERVGLGALNGERWVVFVGLAVFINLAFYLVFRSGFNLRFREPSLTQAQIVIWALWVLLPLSWLPAARPLLVMFFLVPFSFGMLQLGRRQYLVTLSVVLGLYVALLTAEWLLERPGFRLGFELFVFTTFALLLTWFSLFGGFISDLRRKLHRQRDSIQLAHDKLSFEIAARATIAAENDRLIAELQESLGTVKKLSGLLPICASCKKIRDDRGEWSRIETYIRSHSEAEFSHGICPECAEKLYPELSPSERDSAY